MIQGMYHGTLIPQMHSNPHLAQMAALIVLVNIIGCLAFSEALGKMIFKKENLHFNSALGSQLVLRREKDLQTGKTHMHT